MNIEAPSKEFAAMLVGDMLTIGNFYNNPDLAFFGRLFMQVKKVVSYDVQVAATNGKVILYNPTGLAKYTQEERIFIHLHEILHIVDSHALYKLDLAGPKIFNIAADCNINYTLKKAGLKVPNLAVTFDSAPSVLGTYENYDYEGSTLKTYYKMLQDVKNTPELNIGPETFISPNEEEDSDGNQQSLDHISDLITKKLKSDDPDLSDANEQDINTPMTLEDIGNLINHATDGEGASSIPDHFMNRSFKRVSPKVSWKNILKYLLVSTNNKIRTYKRPSRRPSMTYIKKGTIKLPNTLTTMVAIDVSCSINEDTFNQFMSEIYSIFTTFKFSPFELLQFSTEIEANNLITTVEDLPKVEFADGGGTCIKSTIQHFQESTAKTLIVFTDGHLQYQDKWKDLNIVWLLKDYSKTFLRWAEQNPKHKTITIDQ